MSSSKSRRVELVSLAPPWVTVPPAVGESFFSVRMRSLASGEATFVLVYRIVLYTTGSSKLSTRSANPSPSISRTETLVAVRGVHIMSPIAPLSTSCDTASVAW